MSTASLTCSTNSLPEERQSSRSSTISGVIPRAAHVIDRGPGVGFGGGTAVLEDTPGDVVDQPTTTTGIYFA
jgi:hypothetical protein